MPTERWAAQSYDCNLPLDADCALVVTGALSGNPADRSLRREAIWPVQVIFDDRAHLAPFFRPIGEFGISSFAFGEDPSKPIFFSSGTELYRLDLEDLAAVRCDLPELIDVHEISYEQDRILIANTGRDEVASYWPRNGSASRISLDPFRRREATAKEKGQPVDRFHVNQAFRGLDGDLWALVHHFEGWQLLRRVIGGVIKSQGDGGLLNLDKKRAINLGLAGPHSVRIVGDEYWLMNSGLNEIVTYSREWQRRRTIASTGWGRGLATSGDIAYAGISPVRKRYRPMSDPVPSQPMVQALLIPTGEPLAAVTLLNIEQINNVYCVPRSIAASLLSL